jgi:hypothetical protein
LLDTKTRMRVWPNNTFEQRKPIPLVNSYAIECCWVSHQILSLSQCYAVQEATEKGEDFSTQIHNLVMAMMAKSLLTPHTVQVHWQAKCANVLVWRLGWQWLMVCQCCNGPWALLLSQNHSSIIKSLVICFQWKQGMISLMLDLPASHWVENRNLWGYIVSNFICILVSKMDSLLPINGKTSTI